MTAQGGRSHCAASPIHLRTLFAEKSCRENPCDMAAVDQGFMPKSHQ